jgi:hypothetical protein
MKCRDCGKEKILVERNRCQECKFKYDYEKSHKSYLKRKNNGTLKKYGEGICSVCHKKMVLNKPNQMTHKECVKGLSLVKNDYNIYPRNKEGKTIAFGMVEELMEIQKGYVVHHLDGNPLNNTYDNFLVLSVKDHASLHSFLRKIRSVWLKDQISKNENCWKSIIAQETKTWLEITGVNVIKISEIWQSAAEPLICKKKEEGSETMHVLSETSNVVDKDIVRTLTA